MIPCGSPAGVLIPHRSLLTPKPSSQAVEDSAAEFLLAFQDLGRLYRLHPKPVLVLYLLLCSFCNSIAENALISFCSGMDNWGRGNQSFFLTRWIIWTNVWINALYVVRWIQFFIVLGKGGTHGMTGIRESIWCMYIDYDSGGGMFQSSPNQFLLVRVHIPQICGWLQA